MGQVFKYWFVALCCVVLLSCGVQHRAVVSESEGGGVTREAEVPDSLKATFAYIDALRLAMTDAPATSIADKWKQTLKADSMHAPTIYQIALAAVDSNDLELAELGICRALEIDSTNIWYHIAHGRILLMREKFGEALPKWRKITAASPSNPENYHLLSALYKEQNMLYSAIEVLDTAEVKAGLYPELHLNKCALLAQVGNIERARTELERYHANYPYDTQAGLMLASVYDYIKRDSLKVATLREVLAIEPANSEALMSLYAHLQGKGKVNEFLQTALDIVWSDEIGLDTKLQVVKELTSDTELRKRYFPQLAELTHALVTQYPTEYDIVELRAMLVMATVNTNTGVDIIKEFFRSHPDNEKALELVVYFEGARNNYDTVRTYYNLHREACPQSIKPIILLANLEQYLNEDLAEADRLYKQALKLSDNNPERSSIVGMQADMRHSEGKHSQAYKLYNKALKIHPDNASALNNYAYFLSLDSIRLEDAKQMAARAVELAPTNASYLDTYAWVLFLLGDTEQALRTIKQAVSLDGMESPEILIHYGDILYATGEKFMARMYWRRAQNAGYDPAQIEQRLKLP